MSDSSSNLTILLVLKDRVELTYRWMDYANLVKFPFKVLIADGGSDKSVERRLSIKGRYENVDYHYLRYPYDNTYLDFYTKLATALSKIDTDYVALADNDDFFIVNSLIKSVDFLSKNPEYISCGGETGGLFIKDKKSFEIGLSAHKPFDIDQDDPVERIRELLNCYEVTYYDVHRTGQLKLIFHELMKLNPSDLFISEIVTTSLAAVGGKVKKNDYLYMVRQNNTPGSTAVEIQKMNNYFGRMFVDSWSRDCRNFFTTVAKALSNKSETPDDMELVVTQHYRNFLLKNVYNDHLNNIPFIKRVIARYLLNINSECQHFSTAMAFYRKIYSLFFRVRCKNGKEISRLSKILWFSRDVDPIVKILNKSKAHKQ